LLACLDQMKSQTLRGPKSTRTSLASTADHAIFVEAALLASSRAETAADRRRNVVYEALDSIHSPDFWLWILPGVEGNAAPPLGVLTHELEEWLATLDR
jgi:hypothetical protein